MYKIEETMLNTNRLENLSDGIFAIAMTLLVLNINIPDSSETNKEVANILINETHTFFIFGLSFIILAVFFILHHKQFHFIEKTTKGHIWINIIFLMLISLMPFISSLVGDYSNDFTARTFFNINIFLLGFILYLNWKYASKHDLLKKGSISEKEIIKKEKGCMVLPVLAVIAVGISVITPIFSPFVYLLSPIIKKFII